MRPALHWVVVVVLCEGAVAIAQDAGMDPRLLEAQATFEEATKLKNAGRYAEAIPKAERALSLWEAALGSTDMKVAMCLNVTGELYRRQGGYARAEALLQRGLSTREAALGKAHPDVAESLNELGLLSFEQGKYDRAQPLFERALAIQEAALDKGHPAVAQTLDNMGFLSFGQGQYDRAERLHERALAIREAALGPAHPLVAQTLNNLARVYGQGRGQYDRAEPLFERALSIVEAALGPTHPTVAVYLQNLAINYVEQGRYDRAAPLHERALAIREALLGPTHPKVAASLNSLATFYAEQGLHEQAEPLYVRALEIREASLGKAHPDVANSLTGLGILYSRQGRYDRAEPLYERALAIREAALGKTHPVVAQSLDNLANLYNEQGQYERAEPLYQRALGIYEAALGKTHPDVAKALNNLAALNADRGQYSRAEALQERALAIREAALGRTHADVAISLTNLATLHARQGQYARAEPLYERAISIWDAALGGNPGDVTQSYNEFGLLHLRQRRLADALPLFMRALTISEGRLRREALDFSQARLESLLQLLGRDEQRLYSLGRVDLNDAGARRLALTAALLFKGRSTEVAADTSRTIRSLGAGDRDAFERLRGLRTQLAKLSLGGPGRLAAAEYQQRLSKLADDGDALEAELAKRSSPLRALTTRPPPAAIVERVAAALPKDGVLIELVDYTDRPLIPRPEIPESKLPAQPRYLAMVLFPDSRTGAIDLGPAAPIDAAASRMRDALASRDADYQGAAQKLQQLIFKPLLPLLGDTRKLFVSPDGQLALIPFAALHDGRRFLADTFDFTYLTSGRDLLARPDDVPGSTSIVILADPDYAASPPPAQVPTTERSYSVERFFSERRDGFSGRGWASLPGTRQEGEAIRQLLPQARLFVGPDASKERLLHLAPPRILHIATHGFFLEDAAAPSGGRGLADIGPLGSGPLPRLQDPLLRSGLVLAGAGAPADLSSSLVTALELAGLNLWGTQLVVLSACDTGRGDIKRGQGVYGLRRSFIVAGAETLVVSLWKVDDQVTRTLMESYYRNLLAGQGRVAALSEAMLALRKEHPHPHYWAPFIAIGRDAPLRAFADPAQQP